MVWLGLSAVILNINRNKAKSRRKLMARIAGVDLLINMSILLLRISMVLGGQVLKRFAKPQASMPIRKSMSFPMKRLLSFAKS